VDRVASSLRALLSNLIDYAGLYPPAALPLPEVLKRYQVYIASAEGWMLNRVILPASKLREAGLRAGWRASLLVDDEPGPLPPEIETLETKLARRLSLPTYCEAPVDSIADAFAKVRTGGLTPEAIPSSAQVADFLCRAAARRLPFKATAGLHHAVRSVRPLTYAPDSPRAPMHGFLNVFVAAAFVWQGMDRDGAAAVLDEQDAAAFEFLDGELRWRGRSLAVTGIESARREFAHSFGSCSFEEPVQDMRALKLLP
jgi:hypothetical protein